MNFLKNVVKNVGNLLHSGGTNLVNWFYSGRNNRGSVNQIRATNTPPLAPSRSTRVESTALSDHAVPSSLSENPMANMGKRASQPIQNPQQQANPQTKREQIKTRQQAELNRVRAAVIERNKNLIETCAAEIMELDKALAEANDHSVANNSKVTMLPTSAIARISGSIARISGSIVRISGSAQDVIGYAFIEFAKRKNPNNPGAALSDFDKNRTAVLRQFAAKKSEEALKKNQAFRHLMAGGVAKGLENALAAVSRVVGSSSQSTPYAQSQRVAPAATIRPTQASAQSSQALMSAIGEIYSIIGSSRETRQSTNEVANFVNIANGAGQLKVVAALKEFALEKGDNAAGAAKILDGIAGKLKKFSAYCSMSQGSGEKISEQEKRKDNAERSSVVQTYVHEAIDSIAHIAPEPKQSESSSSSSGISPSSATGRQEQVYNAIVTCIGKFFENKDDQSYFTEKRITALNGLANIAGTELTAAAVAEAAEKMSVSPEKVAKTVEDIIFDALYNAEDDKKVQFEDIWEALITLTPNDNSESLSDTSTDFVTAELDEMNRIISNNSLTDQLSEARRAIAGANRTQEAFDQQVQAFGFGIDDKEADAELE
ncbi:MAG: hypothetical protein LBI61_01830 [Puniceicoccales bacterium]|jgi:hypothetical protein|nr:hypothetical protein [Puniceicoccales bacterium]